MYQRSYIDDLLENNSSLNLNFKNCIVLQELLIRDRGYINYTAGGYLIKTDELSDVVP